MKSDDDMTPWNGVERRILMPDGERIASLEVAFHELKAGQVEIIAKLEALRDDMTRYRSFIAGIVWIGGAIVGGLALLWELGKDTFNAHWK